MFSLLSLNCLPRMPQSVNLAVSAPRAKWMMVKVPVWKNINVHVNTMGVYMLMEHKFKFSATPGMTLFYKMYSIA